jgi:peroxiredoxin
MTITRGSRVPAVDLTIMSSEGPKPVDLNELCANGTSVLFAVPGAFTPTCSAQHLPGFVERADELRARGVDRIICTAVNDVFVMDAWGRDGGVNQKIIMAADGNGELARTLGLEFDGSAFGMGHRSQRYALIIHDGTINQVLVENPGEFRVSSAEYVLEQL